LARGRIKGYWCVFVGPKAIIAVILLAVIISVVSRIFGAVFPQANGRLTQPLLKAVQGGAGLTLLSTTTTDSDGTGEPVLNEPQIKARPGQSAPEHTKNNPLENSEQNPKQVDEWETVRMRVTAYCPCEKCCGEYADGITACGHKIHPGDAFAAADRRYSFGTEMVVAGYNNGQLIKVLDRGGAIRGNRLDVFFHSHEEALQWGVKYVDVKVRQAER